MAHLQYRKTGKVQKGEQPPRVLCFTQRMHSTNVGLVSVCSDIHKLPARKRVKKRKEGSTKSMPQLSLLANSDTLTARCSPDTFPTQCTVPPLPIGFRRPCHTPRYSPHDNFLTQYVPKTFRPNTGPFYPTASFLDTIL